MFYNNLGNVFVAKGDLDRAAACFQKAIQTGPGYAEAGYGLGKTRQLQGRLDEAIEAYSQVLRIKPEMTETLINLGQAYHASGKIDRAIECYRRVNLKNPEDSDADLLLAAAYLDRNQPKTARGCLKKLLAREPSNINALFKLGLAEEKLKRPESAAAAYLRVIDLDPNFPEVFINLGRIYKVKHELKKAMACYQSALMLNPAVAAAHNNVGTIQLQLGESSEAIESFQKALDLNPGNVPALHNLGNAYQKMGRLEEAIYCYRKTLEIEPDYISAYYHLGLVHQTRKEHEQAIDCFRKVLALNPDNTKAACYLFHQLQQICAWRELDDLGARIDSATRDALNKSARPDEVPFLTISRRIDPVLAYEVGKAWSAEIEHCAANAPGVLNTSTSLSRRDRVRKRKITLGYLSNTFSNHPGSHLISGMFKLHDRSAFEILCFSFGADDGSYYRKRVERDSDKFFDIRCVSDSAAAELMYHHHTDILIDLRGFTHDSRLGISAMRPAPIQVVYLGYPGTTGAGFIDYIIADKIVVPKEHIEYFGEKIIYMPHCYQVNDHTQKIADRRLNRGDCGIPEDTFAFCSFVTHYKLEPVMFSCWMRILKRVPASILYLLTGSEAAQKNLRNESAKYGIDDERLIFGKKLPKDEHLARLQLMDLSLDTRIYNGHTTTSDALWASVPVLALKGGHFASRVSASILQAIGLPELVTNELREYEELAVELANSPERISSLKNKIRANRLKEPLFDTPGFTRNLERAYREMMEIFLAGGEPRQIEVKDA
jgi:protein O-GlcNAc transferase